MKRDTRLGVAILGVTGLFVIGLTVALFLFAGGGSYDPDTLCRTDNPATAHTVLIVDKTDPLTEIERRGLRRLLDRLKGELEQGERLSIMLITEDVPLFPTPVFSLCNPGRAANPIYQNPQTVANYYEEKFGRPLDAILERLLLGETAAKSPILETISQIAARSDFAATVPKRTLILLSDMLQNSNGYTHYADGVTFDAFARLPYAETVKADLTGTEVMVYYLSRKRDARFQGRRHIRFWEDYFRADGARDVHFNGPTGPAAGS